MIDFQQLQSKNVLVIGDIMLDSFWSTNSKGISPEANVEIWNLNDSIESPGGAGNVAWNIKSLRSNPILLGVVGDDYNGQILLQVLNNAGIKTNFILKEEGRITTHKIRVHKNGRLQHRIDHERTDAVNNVIQKELLESLDDILENNKIDVAVLQDYNKGVLFAENIPVIISKLRNHYIPILVDPKFDNFDAYKNIDLFKPNWKEFCHYSKISELSELVEASYLLQKEMNFKNLLITLSEKGSFYYNKEMDGINPTINIQDADVCGAGDTVAAIAALGLSNQWSLKDISSYANLCAGMVCNKKGVQPITFEELSTND